MAKVYCVTMLWCNVSVTVNVFGNICDHINSYLNENELKAVPSLRKIEGLS